MPAIGVETSIKALTAFAEAAHAIGEVQWSAYVM